jgi:hypothetical protein
LTPVSIGGSTTSHKSDDGPSISLAWRTWRNSAKYSVSDGRTAIGAVFERRKIFTAVDANGRLIGAFLTLRAAARALPSVAGSSS